MKIPLYRLLADSENLNYRLSKLVESREVEIQQQFKEVKELFHLDQSHIALPRFETIDIPELQRQLFSLYENNTLLQQAMSGKKSLEESTRELAKPFQGYWLGLPKLNIPHRKNPQHNKKVVELKDIVEEAEAYKTCGILSPTNQLTNTLYISAFIIPTIVAMAGFIRLTDQGILQPIPKYGFSLAGSFLTVALGSQAGLRSEQIQKPIEQAQYIDKKIIQLYK